MDHELQRAGHSVRGIANWILDFAEKHGVRHTNMGINKLAFFAVEAFLIKRQTLITNAKIEAWDHGPVFRELYQSFKSYGNGYIAGRARRYSVETGEFHEVSINLSEEDNAFLESAIRPIIFLSAAELRARSHRPGSAWDRVWWYKGHANPGMEITPGLVIEAKQGGEVEES